MVIDAQTVSNYYLLIKLPCRYVTKISKSTIQHASSTLRNHRTSDLRFTEINADQLPFSISCIAHYPVTTPKLDLTTSYVKTCMSCTTFSHMTMHHLSNEERSFAIILYFKNNFAFNNALATPGPPFHIKPAHKSHSYKIHSVHRKSEQARKHQIVMNNIRKR
jgi:hypothetical protein